MTAVAILAGVQLLTCGADPIPAVRRIVTQMDSEVPGSAVDDVTRLLVFAVVAGLTLSRLIA